MDHEKNILITGASGLLGRSLKARLEGMGNVAVAGFSHTAAGLFPVDLRDAEALKGLLKVEAEDLVLQRDAGLVLRIPLLIGAGPNWEGSGFIFKIVAQIQDPTSSSLDHSGIRFPTWTDDVAEAVAHLLGIKERGIYHYSSLEGGTKYEWAMELANLAGLSMEHITPDREGSASRAVRPKNTQLAVEKIRQTGLSRFTPFRDVAQSVMKGLNRS
jgi:dTDP-4-dehydrorhamnose reductase